jgi:hypothetical protein
VAGDTEADGIHDMYEATTQTPDACAIPGPG